MANAGACTIDWSLDSNFELVRERFAGKFIEIDADVWKETMCKDTNENIKM